MQTLLYVSEMDLGSELEVRRIHEKFPIEALQRGIGVERLASFIGSGYYAMEITVSDGDFQQNFHRFLREPEIQELFRSLGRHVRNLPWPDETTADMPLATAMLVWQKPGTTDATTV